MTASCRRGKRVRVTGTLLEFIVIDLAFDFQEREGPQYIPYRKCPIGKYLNKNGQRGVLFIYTTRPCEREHQELLIGDSIVALPIQCPSYNT